MIILSFVPPSTTPMDRRFQQTTKPPTGRNMDGERDWLSVCLFFFAFDYFLTNFFL
jgi:hypothetical protein